MGSVNSAVQAYRQAQSRWVRHSTSCPLCTDLGSGMVLEPCHFALECMSELSRLRAAFNELSSATETTNLGRAGLE